MTQTEINNLLSQINEAFKDQTSQLEELKKRLEALESKLNDQEKRPKANPRGRKRVQQAEADAESSD